MSSPPAIPAVDWLVQVVGLGCSVLGCPCADTIDEAPYAYTIGLWEKHGHPELVMGARPDAGNDVGGAWFLSSCDLCVVLNQYARRCLMGELSSGSSALEPVDGGRGTMSCLFGDPVPARSVGALGAYGADAIRISWSLSLNRSSRRATQRRYRSR